MKGEMELIIRDPHPGGRHATYASLQTENNFTGGRGDAGGQV